MWINSQNLVNMFIFLPILELIFNDPKTIGMGNYTIKMGKQAAIALIHYSLLSLLDRYMHIFILYIVPKNVEMWITLQKLHKLPIFPQKLSTILWITYPHFQNPVDNYPFFHE